MAGRSKAAVADVGYLTFLRANPMFLGFGFALTFFSGFGQTYFISTFGDAIRETFDLTQGEWGTRYGIATGTSAVLLMWAGRFIDRFDLRTWTAGLLVALAGACVLMATTPSGTLLVLSLFAMRFAGQGLMGHTAMTSMTRYFDAERARAATLAGLGFAAGFALFPPLGGWMQGALSWRTSWFVLAGVAGGIVLPLALFLLRGHKARHAAWLARTSAAPSPGTAGSHGVTPATVRQWTRAQVLRDWRMWCLLPGSLASPFLLTGTIFFYADIARSKGWEPAYLERAMFASGIALYVSSMLIGPVVDRLGARRLVAFAPIPLALAMAVLGAFDHPASAYAYVICAGVAMGSLGPAFGSLWPELYGTVHLGSIRAFLSACMVGATALSPALFGKLLDMGVTMPMIAWGGCAYSVLAMFLMVPAARAEAVPR